VAEKPAPGKAAPAAAAAPASATFELPTPPVWWKTLRADPPVALRLVIGAIAVAALFFVWWLLTHGDEPIVSPVKLPSPGDMIHDSELPDLLDHILGTLQRVFLGVGLAALIGVSLGLLAGANRAIAAFLAPLVIFLRSIPMGALLPLMLLAFHAGEEERVMFLFFAIVPFVFSDTVKAVALVPERYIETALTLGASNGQILRKVLVPLAVPDIITSLRFQVGLALGYIMLAEDIDVRFGIGHLISNSQRLGKQENVYMLLFIIAGLAFGIDLLLRTLQRGAFAWRQDL
jgi:ABC-type nitrate/sulfonate/bicarbonate transport system permease component